MRRLVLALGLLSLAWPSTAAVLYVAPGASVQAAIDSAAPGDEIVLQSGATYTEALIFPDKGGTVTLRSSAGLPDRRIGPNDRALLASLGSGAVAPAARVVGSHWRFVGVAFRANSNGEGDIITVTGLAGDILFDRLLIEGGPNGQKRGIAVNGGQVTITRCHIANIWKLYQDSQAIAGWDGPGPVTITDNYLEAASENVMFGGADSSSPDRIPSDILIEGNHFTKNLSWRGASGKAVKNLFELKSARRVVVRGNLFEHNWVDGQSGWAIVITPRNADGNAPWSTVEDLLFENNTVSDTPSVFNVLGRSDVFVSQQARGLTFRNNVLINVSESLLQAGGEVGDITLDHNTSMNSGTLIKLYRGEVRDTTGALRTSAYAVGTLTIVNSLMVYGEYGIWGEGSAIGTSALEDHTLSYDMRRNVVAGEMGWQHLFPPDTQQPTLDFHYAQFNADYSLVEGSPYKLSALDGLDMGWIGATTAEPPPPPPANTPPAASFSVRCSGLSCTFTDTSTDANDAIVSWAWQFGDGSSASVRNPTHTYSAPGRFIVRLDVTDESGATTSSTGTARVRRK